MTVTVTPFDHKSKMRVIEHGAIWRIIPAWVQLPGRVLLQSVQTGYLKWWPITHTNPQE